MPNDARVIRQTQAWVSSVVVGCNFCPFAKRELDRGSIHFRVSNGTDLQTSLEVLIEECLFLDKKDDVETTLLIYPNNFAEFDDFLDAVNLAEALLVEQGYQGIYQLANFHPDYRFADAPADDPANYTNRSPYPTWHLIREASMERALAAYPDADGIPRRNIEFARKKGKAEMQAMREACFNPE